MKSAAIRNSFVEFFAERGHRALPSSPLVPHGDPTLLFTNAGMVQFKDYFTGAAVAPEPRAVTVQKCLRVSGKHNDLENVGPSPRHHTFFEMLGNFSFGDYFKADAIEWGWQLVTAVWGLPKERLFATVFREDDEAHDLWRKISGLPDERVLRCGEKDNFWAMGETGPCGPCSEIFVDCDPSSPAVDWQAGTDSGRYLEIWNLVFMQFERDASGAMRPLPKPSIDTGAGLERVAAVLAGVPSNYDTDLFRPILAGGAALAGTGYGRDAEADVSLRVVADHLRAVAFLLADGVVPSNEGRGYVLRRLLRRAVRHGMRLGFEEPFLCRLLPLVDEAMAGAYAELAATRTASEATIRSEEEKFLSTVATGSRMVQTAIEEARAAGSDRLSGAVAFRLYDTYGLPIQLLREIAEEERFRLDEEGFERELEEQRRRSRAAGGGAGQWLARIRERTTGAAGWGSPGETRFVGFVDRLEGSGQKLSSEGVKALRVIRIAADGSVAEADGGARRLESGEEGVLVVPVTPFYAEGGGQVGDQGWVSWQGGRAEVLDTQKDSGVFYHRLRVLEGSLDPELPLTLTVDPDKRLATERNHTATHLLHAALRRVLGEGVRQAGSLVHPEHLRFDFTHARPLTEEEKDRVVALVDAWVLRAQDLAIVGDRPIEEARAAGAMALFGEKYGERVRTVEIPGFSLELCGGCHVRNTGEIGPFVLRSERGIASGVRRIEALTGAAALAWLRGRDRALGEAEAALGVEPGRAADGIEALRAELKAREQELARLRVQLVSGGGGVGSEVQAVGGVKVLAREVPPAPAGELRHLADVLRDKLGSGVVVLGTRDGGKVTLLAAVTPDLRDRVPAGRLVKEIAVVVGGSGGGRPDFAQAGGKDPERLPEALARVPEAVGALLAGAGS
ncbi:MAG TPA: alanine--tRNA ligase [Thermoanaerobaculia bacterium]|nr:alanine--tRNA ligase [Thermoanaerobaculia bacterium]